MMSEGDGVLEALKVRLETIKKTNGFSLDIAYVDRQFKWPDDIGQRFPALLVLPGVTVPHEKALQSTYQMVDRGVSVLCYVYEQHSPSTVLENLQAEVLKCVFSDPVNLGTAEAAGPVVDIKWIGADTSANAFSVVGFSVGYAPPIGVARLDFILRHHVNLLGGA